MAVLVTAKEIRNLNVDVDQDVNRKGKKMQHKEKFGCKMAAGKGEDLWELSHLLRVQAEKVREISEAGVKRPLNTQRNHDKDIFLFFGT